MNIRDAAPTARGEDNTPRWRCAMGSTIGQLALAGGQQGAVFDASKTYRYRLWRDWGSRPRAVFVLLNPSTADETANDPTVRRCIGYAQAWGFGGLEVVNLFALRSTDPRALRDVKDPVGPDNDRAILEATRGAGSVVAAWGNHGSLNGRARDVRKLLAAAGVKLHALRLLKSGEPGHPLYLPADLQPLELPEVPR